MKIALPIILVIAVGVLLGAWNIKRSAERSAAAQLVAQARDGLEVGKSTAAERAWDARVGRECARRNARLAEVKPPRGGLKDLQRYSSQVLRVQRRHVQALPTSAAPPRYASKAAFVRAAEKRREDALRKVVNAGANRDSESAELAVTMLESLERSTSSMFRSIGLPSCAQLR
jgi:hypothetical protein